MPLVAMAFLGLTLDTQAQTFFEDFTNGIPAEFKLINNDGNTPNAAVEFVNDAWVSYEDAGNGVALSTSWYSPAGTSDDWLITPPIVLGANDELTFKARAFDASFNDGFAVYISLDGDSISDFLREPALKVVPGENNVFTEHSINLADLGYTDTTVQIAIVNNSSDMYLLAVDDIKVAEVIKYNPTLSAVSNPTQFGVTPLEHTIPFNFAALVTNSGADSLTGVTVNLTVLEDGVEVYTDTKTAAGSLLPGEDVVLEFDPNFTPEYVAAYTVAYEVSSAEIDEVESDNILIKEVSVSDTTFGRDNGQVVSSLGIGPGTPGILGQTTVLEKADVLTSISFYLVDPTLGEPVSAEVYNMVDGQPGEVIATTDEIIISDSGAQFLTLPLSDGPLGLPAGEFYVGILEDDANLTLGYTFDIFTPGTTFLDFPGNPVGGWANNEMFGFNVTYVIRPNFAQGCFLDAEVSATDATCATCEDGTASVSEPTGGVAPFTYAWDNGATTAEIADLAQGTYAVTVTDGEGCTFDGEAVVSGPAATGVALADNFLNLSTYPNPAVENLTVEFSTGSLEEATVVLSNSLGQVIATYVSAETVDHNVQVDVSDVATGLYYVTVSTPTSIKKKRVVVK